MNDDAWLISMLFASILGGIAGVVYPMLIAWYKKLQDAMYITVSDNKILNKIAFVILTVLIATIVVVLGFVAFVGNEQTRQALYDSGMLAYFSAFSSGFTAASFIEEPLKKQ